MIQGSTLPPIIHWMVHGNEEIIYVLNIIQILCKYKINCRGKIMPTSSIYIHYIYKFKTSTTVLCQLKSSKNSSQSFDI